jgi:hypothetical protein
MFATSKPARFTSKSGCGAVPPDRGRRPRRPVSPLKYVANFRDKSRAAQKIHQRRESDAAVKNSSLELARSALVQLPPGL